MATFTVIEALQADPIWEADFKFNFEHVGFGVTLREREAETTNGHLNLLF